MKENWKAFSETAQTFLAKARACAKASDAQAFYQLAEAASSHSLKIWQELVSNSVMLALQAGITEFSAYIDFCSRNGLEALSESDFKAVLAEIERQS